MPKVVAVVAVFVGIALLRSAVDPETPFLPPQQQVTWWAHPQPLSLHGHVGPQSLVFVGTTPGGRLLVTAMSRMTLYLDDQKLLQWPEEGQSWKSIATLDVPPGSLRLEVSHPRLRPVVGLGGIAAPTSLQVADSLSMVDAVRVSTFARARRALPDSITSAVLLLAPLLVVAFGALLTRPKRDFPAIAPRPGIVVAIVILHSSVALWNCARYPLDRGLDADGHRTYVELIRQSSAIPSANASWQTYHPPLFHTLGAIGWQLTGTDRALQFVSTLAGIALVVAVAWFLGPQCWRGTLLIGSLPVLLLSEPQATNEVLFAALATTALGLIRMPLSVRRCAVIGLVLGLALQTKYTGALLLPGVCLAILAANAVCWQSRIRQIVTVVAVCAIVGGLPYYERWQSYGDPFIGNWNDALGQPYRQPPGVRTATYFTTFGASLVAHPFEARSESLWDALYVSLFADGFGRFVTRPTQHWLSACLVWLALPLTLTVLVGWLRTALGRGSPTPSDYAGVITVGIVLAALVRFNIELPYWSTAKGVFLLGLSLPAARGLENGRQSLAAHGGHVTTRLLDVVLGAFAVLSFVTFVYR